MHWWIRCDNSNSTGLVFLAGRILIQDRLPAQQILKESSPTLTDTFGGAFPILIAKKRSLNP